MHAEIRARSNGTILGLLQIGPALITQLNMLKTRIMPTIRITVPSRADTMWGINPVSDKLTEWTIEVGVVPFVWTNLDTKQENVHWMLAVNDDLGHIFAHCPTFTPIGSERKAVVLAR